MRILHVFNELKPSGGEAMMLSAARVWLEKHEQSILSTGEVPGAFAEKLSKAGYQIEHIPFQKRIGFFLQLARLIRKHRYDLIHLHPERGALAYSLAIRLLVSRRIPIVRTVHHLFRFDGLLRLRKLLERQIMKRLLGVRFLSNSPSGKRNEKHRYAMENELAPNWYDDQFYRPPTDEQRKKSRNIAEWKDSLTVFLSLGGNWGYKNYDLIVQALSLIPEHYPILYAQLGVQGVGRPLETLAAKLGVSHRLQCLGVVPDPLPYLHAADVYLMPSSEEGFGVAAVEAMASGLPAILSNVEALCDFGTNICEICYVEPTPTSIADAMIRFCDLSTKERRNIGNLQATDVRKHYGTSAGPMDYLRVWQQELNQ